MLVADSKPRQEHLNSHRNSNLQQRISLQRVGQNPLILAFGWMEEVKHGLYSIHVDCTQEKFM